MSPSTKPESSFQIRRILRTSREKVFAAWTQKDLLEQWMCKDAPAHQAEYVELDVRPGGRYVVEIKLPEGKLYRGRGTFREVNPPAKLVFTWFWEDGDNVPLHERESLVTVELFEAELGTEIVLTHELLANIKERDEHKQGWEGCINVLAEVLK